MARLKSWGGRKDANHGEIKDYFEALGCKVLDVSQLPGCCDLIVKLGKKVVFVEIKDPQKPPSARKLTEAEQEFHDYWGDVEIVEWSSDVEMLVARMIQLCE